MFTGLVESMGRVVRLTEDPPGRILAIDLASLAEDVAIGDSISINGCCLTVIRREGSVCDFEAGEETLSRTNLGRIEAGHQVNLERSLRVGDRLGGHYVTGHIDCVGRLIERTEDPPWANLRFSIPDPHHRQVASKGSIAIDGVSLTVVDADTESFTVALIPHTLAETTLGGRQVGDPVNLETDVLAKYVAKLVS